MPELDLRYVKREELMSFINTTPKGTSATWNLYGRGVSDSSIAYEANETTEQYIIDSAATTIVEGYGLGFDGPQKAIAGDPVFDFVDGLRYVLATGTDAETEVVLVDKYKENADHSFRAQKFKASVSVSSWGGAGGTTPTIEYKVNLNGTPVQGSATIVDGVMTFTPTTRSM